MLHTLLRAATATTLALATIAPASAQNHVIAPDNAALSQPSSSSLGWRNSTTGFRTQFLYDSSHFTNLGVDGPCVITRMRFRAGNGQTATGGLYVGDGTSVGVTVDIGTATTDYLAPSPQFTLNRGAMQNVMQLATVAVAPSAGTAPNTYVIDLPIPGGFAYDPTAGLDLILDVSGPAFSGALPTFATGASLPASRCTRISGTPTAASSGSITGGFGSVVLFDITGPGGIPGSGGTPRLEAGTAVPFGVGCGFRSSRAFGELFGPAIAALDLGGGIRLTPDQPFAPTRYTVSAAAGPLVATATAPLLANNGLPMADDSTSLPCGLGFTFPFVGGSTAIVHATTNGYALLTATAIGGADSSAALTDLAGETQGTHAGMPRVCPVWYDFDASRNTSTVPGSGVYFDTDPTAQRAWITWNAIGEFATATGGAKQFTFQVELAGDGSIEFRYGPMSPFGSASPSLGAKVVGFAPGSGAATPVSVDLSAAMPLLTGTVDRSRLGLAFEPPPRIGSTTVASTHWVPAPGVVLHWISSTALPGLDLSLLGITGGCSAFVDPATSIRESLLFGTGTVSFGIAVPFDLALIGVDAVSQSAALDPAYNAFGAVTSNGVTLHIGTVY